MALRVEQLRDRDATRRAAAVPPAPDPVPASTVYPGGVYFSEVAPENVVPGALWVPLNADGSAKSLDQWQVYS